MKKQIKLLTLLLLVLTSQTASANLVSFYAGPGLLLSKPNTSNHSAKLSFLNAQALVDVNLLLVSLESGLIYLNRQASYEILGISGSTQHTILEIPLFVRFGVGPISLGVGPYYGTVLGNYQVKFAGISHDFTPEQAGLKSSEIGAGASLRVSVLPFLYAEGRFHYSLTDMSNKSSSTLRFADTSLFVGYSF